MLRVSCCLNNAKLGDEEVFVEFEEFEASMLMKPLSLTPSL
jgi:hypothetical protein